MTPVDEGIHSAAVYGDTEKLEVILSESRVSANALNQFGMTPLHGACFHGQLEAARTLLKYGADANHPSMGSKYTFPLHLATSRLNKSIMELLLLEGKADASLKDYMGQTALDIAQNISIEVDSAAVDPDTNNKMFQFLKECIEEVQKQKRTEDHRPFIYESKKNSENLGRHAMNLLISDSISDTEEVDEASSFDYVLNQSRNFSAIF